MRSSVRNKTRLLPQIAKQIHCLKSHASPDRLGGRCFLFSPVALSTPQGSVKHSKSISPRKTTVKANANCLARASDERLPIGRNPNWSFWSQPLPKAKQAAKFQTDRIAIALDSHTQARHERWPSIFRKSWDHFDLVTKTNGNFYLASPTGSAKQPSPCASAFHQLKPFVTLNLPQCYPASC